jgi:hypothetical protein
VKGLGALPEGLVRDMEVALKISLALQ